MKKTATTAAIAAMLIIFAGSCTKKGNTGATGPAGPPGQNATYTGAVTGHVTVYDQYGSRMFTGLSNIQVTLKGAATVSTDGSGYYYIPNVSTGNYELQASGPGLAPTVLHNVSFLKDTLYQDVKMSLPPTFNLNSFNAYHNPGSLFDSLVINVAVDTRPRNCIIFVNKQGVAGHTPGSYLLSYVKPFATTGWGTTTLIVKVPAADLNNAGMFYGDKVYYSAASYVVNDASAYEDEVTGQMVYDAIGTMLADSTTCP